MTHACNLISLLMVLWTGPGVARSGPDGSQEGQAWSEDGALALRLEVVKPPVEELRQTRLKLTATNTGKKDLILDAELLVGFALRFRTDLSDGVISSKDRDVTEEEVKKWEKPEPEAARKRFVKLAPGQSLARVIDLSQPIRTVQQGHATYASEDGKASYHRGFFYEADVRHQVPPRAKKLAIEVTYERGVWPFARPQFADWFGMEFGQSGVWDGRASSNRVTVER
jgi:hypothetical protein